MIPQDKQSAEVDPEQLAQEESHDKHSVTDRKVCGGQLLTQTVELKGFKEAPPGQAVQYDSQ